MTMNLPMLPTTLIGSLPKPSWLTSEWYSVAGRWNLSGAALAEAFDDATRVALDAQLRAGIDIVCDGEQRRPSHFSYFLQQLGGVDCERRHAKAMRGGQRTQEVPRVVGPVTLAAHHTLDDYRFLRRLTACPVKATLPGPLTLVDGTFDESYGDERALGFAFADALNQELRALQAAGCEMIQLDEPAVTRLPEKLHAWGVEALDRAFDGITATRCVHVCYGYTKRAPGRKQWRHGYEEIFPALARARVDQYSLEFAEPKLPARVLEGLPGKTIQIGVIHAGSDEVETPEAVAARLREALEVLPPERIVAAPDCGLGSLTRASAQAKLNALVLGTKLVRAQLER